MCRRWQANTLKKILCFNCTGTKQRASDCRSNKLCLICNSKHHTSISDKNENVLLTKNSNACTYPLVIVSISNKLCLICNSKHHTSISDKNENVLLTTNSNACTYPLVIVRIEGIKCRTLVDTGAGASYVSSIIISLIKHKANKKPIRTKSKRIETLVSSSMRKILEYLVEIKDVNNEFSFKTEISKLEKSALLELPNPNNREIRNNYQHLRDIT